MEANRTLTVRETSPTNEKKYSYLVKIQVGPYNESMIVVNKTSVPEVVLETMAKDKITKAINTMFEKSRDYRLQTAQAFFSKMIKQSDFEIEDLNNIEIYDLQLKFQYLTDKIVNDDDRRQSSKVFESKINFQLNEEETI